MDRKPIPINYKILMDLSKHPLGNCVYQELKNYEIVIVNDDGQVLEKFVPENNTD